MVVRHTHRFPAILPSKNHTEVPQAVFKLRRERELVRFLPSVGESASLRDLGENAEAKPAAQILWVQIATGQF